ncbi:efflux RND transporter periplasmic adaptor subunit, partial [Pseudomonas sp. CCI1.2]|nr:efflux RND transporter periplasmic adaptor subunit [Pseudomonas sp. CCI1.2]
FETARDQFQKRLESYTIDPKSISKVTLDTAKDLEGKASAALKASSALLKQYTVRAPVEGEILAVNTTVGSYVSSQGAYDTYIKGFSPLVV